MIGDVSTSTDSDQSNVSPGEPDGPMCDDNLAEENKENDENSCNVTTEKPLPDTQPGKDHEFLFVCVSTCLKTILLYCYRSFQDFVASKNEEKRSPKGC